MKSRITTWYGGGILAFSAILAAITVLGLTVVNFNGG
jgi:hypothetical protein